MAEFVRVADVADLPDPGKLLVEVEGDVVALFHVEGRFHAIDDICTHDGGTLADGELVGHKIACPRHGAKFDIRTGAALSMPAVRPTRCHDVKVEDGGGWEPATGPRPAPTTRRPTSAATRPPTPPAPTPLHRRRRQQRRRFPPAGTRPRPTAFPARKSSASGSRR
jgi:3-phenylpropionate/trans-cinnamate dioxygenase ferredoxin subunit